MNQERPISSTNQQGKSDMPLFSSFQQSDDKLSLAQELVLLSDHFAEFVCINAFLSEAFSSMLEKQEEMNEEVVRGAQYCSDSLRTRSFELKSELDQVREKYLAEHEIHLNQDKDL